MTEHEGISYTPRAVNRRAGWAVGILLGLAAVVFALSLFFSEYGGTLQLVSLFMIVYALFLASKFLFVSNAYSLYTKENGVRFFLIEQKQGRRSTLVCQLPLYRIRSVLPFAEAKEEARGRYYTYVASMSGGNYQMLVVDGEKGSVGIKIEASPEFVAALHVALAEKQAPSETEPTDK